MDDFKGRVLDVAQEAEDFINRTGGLPEIWIASQQLRVAFDQTDREIADAVLAGRFSRQVSENFKVHIMSGTLVPRVQLAIEAEGEAGHKRATLAIDAMILRNELNLLLARLVALRCDLVLAQTE